MSSRRVREPECMDCRRRFSSLSGEQVEIEGLGTFCESCGAAKQREIARREYGQRMGLRADTAGPRG